MHSGIIFRVPAPNKARASIHYLLECGVQLILPNTFFNIPSVRRNPPIHCDLYSTIWICLRDVGFSELKPFFDSCENPVVGQSLAPCEA